MWTFPRPSSFSLSSFNKKRGPAEQRKRQTELVFFSSSVTSEPSDNPDLIMNANCKVLPPLILSSSPPPYTHLELKAHLSESKLLLSLSLSLSFVLCLSIYFLSANGTNVRKRSDIHF